MQPITEHRLLLGGDLDVRRIGFGAMRLPCNGFRGPARDPRTGRAVLRRALELGVNLIDTADFYQSSDGVVKANQLIREALHPYDSNLVIATKVGVVFSADGTHRAARASDMRSLVEENLASLGLDRLDLVYLRIGEMTVPHGESISERFEALASLQAEGLIRHLGISNVDANHLAEARSIAPVAAVQNHFHIKRREDRELLITCEEAGIAFCPFFPLGGGMDLDDDRLAVVARRHNASNAQIALAWLLAQSPFMLAIPGTGSVAHLEENVAAAGISLTPEDHDDLA